MSESSHQQNNLNNVFHVSKKTKRPGTFNLPLTITKRESIFPPGTLVTAVKLPGTYTKKTPSNVCLFSGEIVSDECVEEMRSRYDIVDATYELMNGTTRKVKY